MSHRNAVSAGLAASALAALAAGAALGGQSAQPLGLAFSGPKQIQPNVVYKNGLLKVSNNSGAVDKRVKITLTPASAVVKATPAFKRTRLPFYTPETTAYWVITDLRPHTTRVFKLWLKFPVLPKGTTPVFSLVVEGQVLGGGAFNHILVTLQYKKKAAV